MGDGDPIGCRLNLKTERSRRRGLTRRDRQGGGHRAGTYHRDRDEEDDADDRCDRAGHEPAWARLRSKIYPTVTETVVFSPVDAVTVAVSTGSTVQR